MRMAMMRKMKMMMMMMMMMSIGMRVVMTTIRMMVGRRKMAEGADAEISAARRNERADAAASMTKMTPTQTKTTIKIPMPAKRILLLATETAPCARGAE